MLNIADIDKNFAVSAAALSDLVFFNAESHPIRMYGLMREDGMLLRMPMSVAKSVSPGVTSLNAHTAGGRIRFRTNSKRIAIVAKMHSIGKMPHFALTGSAGFDLYREGGDGADYLGTYQPRFDIESTLTGALQVGDAGMQGYTLNMPLYSGVYEVFIGIEPGAVIEAPKPYKNRRPVVFYGSSITQGGCAGKPGDSYQAIISRELNLDYINLGFSGNAKAEKNISDYISSLDMSIFVYDYDHNAPTPEYLQQTHEKMFLAIREKNPELPIIMMSRPRYNQNPDTEQRLNIIRVTYERALLRNDKRVYLIPGRELMALCQNDGTVDGTHPTSLGFYSMAKPLIRIIKEITDTYPDVLD